MLRLSRQDLDNLRPGLVLRVPYFDRMVSCGDIRQGQGGRALPRTVQVDVGARGSRLYFDGPHKKTGTPGKGKNCGNQKNVWYA
jgi:hypothetical protein